MMNKSRFMSFIIMIVAVAFIIFVVVDNFTDDHVQDDLQFTNTGGGSEKKANEASNVPFDRVDEEGLQRGMFAPDFTLPLWHTNEQASLSSFRGKIVVLNLWASWCPPCRDEMPDLVRLHNEYQGKGVKVVGVNLATLDHGEDAVAKFMDEFRVNFPTFVDQSISSTNKRGIVETKYGVRSIPATFILDEDGRIFISIRGKVTYQMLTEQLNKLIK